MDLTKMLGYKFFKEKEDGSVECIRFIKHIKTGNQETLKVIDTNTKLTDFISINDLKKYKPLQPVGVLMFHGVEIENTKDVIVASYLYNRLEQRDPRPFCICRQDITDVFYNILVKDESDMIAGLSMNILNIPSGFDYGLMLLSDKVLFTDIFCIYKDDTVEDLLDTFKEYLDAYDKILEKLYQDHCQAFPEAYFRNEHKGWCRNLKTLLTQNNFQSDLDEMMGITTVDFEINNYLVETQISEENTDTYLSVTDELKYWLSYLYKLNINKVYVLPYDNDIEFEELKNSRYFIFRDNQKKLYVFVYTIDNEYKEAELEELDKKLDFSTKFRINFLDKYSQYHKVQSE